MSPIAATATTGVISPRGQDRAWPRRMIQLRISGAAAAASSSQRRVECASQALSDAGPLVEPIDTKPFLRRYQVRKIPTASSTPPTTATSSDRVSSPRFTARTLARGRGPADDDRPRRAGERRARARARPAARRPAEAIRARARRGERRLEHAALVGDRQRGADRLEVVRALRRELELDLGVVAGARRAHATPERERRARRDRARRREREAVRGVRRLASAVGELQAGLIRAPVARAARTRAAARQVVAQQELRHRGHPRVLPRLALGLA